MLASLAAAAVVSGAARAFSVAAATRASHGASSSVPDRSVDDTRL